MSSICWVLSEPNSGRGIITSGESNFKELGGTEAGGGGGVDRKPRESNSATAGLVSPGHFQDLRSPRFLLLHNKTGHLPKYQDLIFQWLRQPEPESLTAIKPFCNYLCAWFIHALIPWTWQSAEHRALTHMPNEWISVQGLSKNTWHYLCFPNNCCPPPPPMKSSKHEPPADISLPRPVG